MNLSGNLRSEWEFEYPVSEVEAGARGLFNHHSDRAVHYGKLVALKQSEIREKGLTVDPGQNKPNSTYIAPRVTVDATLAQELGELERSRSEHDNQAMEYRRWWSVLDRADQRTPERLLALRIADVEYFGLAVP